MLRLLSFGYYRLLLYVFFYYHVTGIPNKRMESNEKIDT